MIFSKTSKTDKLELNRNEAYSTLKNAHKSIKTSLLVNFKIKSSFLNGWIKTI